MTAIAPRVLVVDDEPQLVRGLNIMLRNAGYVVETARTAADMLAILAARPPDVLVLDYVLPDGQGRRGLQASAAVQQAADPDPVGDR